MNELLRVVRYVIKSHPQVAPLLSGRARWLAIPIMQSDEIKTVDGLTRQVYNLMSALQKSGNINAFLDGMASVVQAQLTRAFRAALREADLDPELVTQDGAGFADELEGMILSEYDFVDGLGADVLDGMTPAEMQSRAELWGNRYLDAYNKATAIIADQYGGLLEWVYGDAEHCDTCLALNGTVAYQFEWEDAGVKPQSPPNSRLDCEGWKCKCRLEFTDKKRTPDAPNKIKRLAKA